MPKQDEMAGDGFDRPKIKAIEEAAAAYVDVRDKRMKLTPKEVEAKTTLIDACKKHLDKLPVNGDGDHVYRFDEEVVIFSSKDQVKVKTAAAEAAEEEE
jgi:hypothetical protein